MTENDREKERKRECMYECLKERMNEIWVKGEYRMVIKVRVTQLVVLVTL